MVQAVDMEHLTAIEREAMLVKAAEDYLHGRISYEEMTAIRRGTTWLERGRKRRAEATEVRARRRRWWRWWRWRE